MNNFRSANLTFPPDPFVYHGHLGIYRFTDYTGSPLSFIWAATFFYTCLGELFDAIAGPNYKASDPYPDGIYTCKKKFNLSSLGDSVVCQLDFRKVAYPGWNMTFFDLAQELQAIWFAALWFQNPLFALPSMRLDIHRYVGTSRATFLAEIGSIMFTYKPAANNVSVT